MYLFFKRMIGIAFSLIMLIMLWPIMIIIAIAIKCDSPGSVIFKQQRMGRNGVPYSMYKFRSMIVGAQSQGTGLYCFSDDKRVTRVGRFIRKTSLDELPQLVNVLIGDMAFVGPRSPVIGGFPNYEDLNNDYKRRFSVPPGITGLAQVVGRNNFSWDEKVEYDIMYIDKVRKYGLLYDLKILLMTIVKIFSMSGVAENPKNMMINRASMNRYVDDGKSE